MGFRTSRTGTFDLDTGEYLEGNQVLIPLRKPGIDGEFIMARQDGLLRLALEKDLTGQDLKVLLVYLACVNFENYIQVEQKWIADYLGMKPQHVYRSTKKLVTARILDEGSKIGHHRTYRLNEFYGWKGDSRNYQKKVRKDAELG